LVRSKATRLTNSLDFDRVYREGRAYRGGLFSVHTFPNRAGTPRLGISVSKKVGSAVTRNMVRRRLREIFYSRLPEIPENMDVVISARPSAAKAEYDEFDREFQRFLDRIKDENGNKTRAGRG
jgi:ribonuclease P protein component